MIYLFNRTINNLKRLPKLVSNVKDSFGVCITLQYRTAIPLNRYYAFEFKKNIMRVKSKKI